jgi:molybdenum cofactor guanylyltransferase
MVAVPAAGSRPKVPARAHPDDVLGVVLAGGAGVRVGGADKGLLPLCGRPLVECVLERLRPQCGRLLIVANRNTGDYARYAPVVHDETDGHAGPLAGLAAAFGFLEANRHALPRWVLTVPVDCPDPPGDLAVRLHTALRDHDKARCAYVRRAGHAQPLFALYRIEEDGGGWCACAREALRGHGSPVRWHAGIGALAVDFGDADDAFHNLNTPADFRGYECTHGTA